MFLPKLSSLVIPPWVKIVWKVAPFLIIAVLAGTVHEKNWAIHDLKQTAQTQKALDDAAANKQQADWAANKSDAIETLALAFANKSTVITANLKESQKYASTPDGLAACLPADRMQSLANERTALEAASASARASHGALPEAGNSGKGPK